MNKKELPILTGNPFLLRLDKEAYKSIESAILCVNKNIGEGHRKKNKIKKKVAPIIRDFSLSIVSYATQVLGFSKYIILINLM